MSKTIQGVVFLYLFTGVYYTAGAQQVLETGGKKMPDEWIDKDTRHKVMRLSRKEGSNLSFYFHNNPFVSNKMVFYSTDKQNGKQLWTVDLNTLQLDKVTSQASPMNGEIVGPNSRSVYYQIKDSVFSTNIDTKQTKLLFVFPADYQGSITTVNADETLFAGAKASDEQKEIARKYPEKSQFFDRIFNAHLLNDLFTIDLKTGQLQKIHTENTWLGHVQFSPTDPDLLMFCHEGPWHKVDRIWTINVKNKEVKLIHKRTMDMEIAGHEFFAPDGKTIWFDHQLPRSVTFYLTGADINTGQEKKYQMTRDEWSIHFNISADQQLFCGDGGDPGQVAKATNGMWIYLFRPNGDKFTSERLVNMKHHGYKLEPNVHFSPDGKWVIFRANFEGEEEVYAVEVKRS
ncbi:MAG: oligogalacturonate lyase family protein [Bacteroidota bacterium]|nr:oligogalacturonate lyase family protein [Bacteroidota bacterium]